MFYLKVYSWIYWILDFFLYYGASIAERSGLAMIGIRRILRPFCSLTFQSFLTFFLIFPWVELTSVSAGHIATTQPTTQNNFCLCGIIISKKPYHTTTSDGITIRAVPGNLGIWFSVSNLILTKQDEIWKTTLIFQKWKKTSIFFKWKTTSIFWKMEDDLKYFQMKDILNLLLNRIQPQFFSDGRWPLEIT